MQIQEIIKKMSKNEIKTKLQDSSVPLKDNTIDKDFSWLKNINRKKSSSSISSDNQSENNFLNIKISKSNNIKNYPKEFKKPSFKSVMKLEENLNNIFHFKSLKERKKQNLYFLNFSNNKRNLNSIIKNQTNEVFRCLTLKDKIDDSESSESDINIDNNDTWIIYPDNIYKHIWDIIMGIFLIYTSLITPYRISFLNEESNIAIKLQLFDNIIDLIFFFDIILNFFTAYYTYDERIEKRLNKIIKHYLKGWFILDLISIIPINLLNEIIIDESTSSIWNNSKIPKIYHLTRLLRLVKIFSKKNHISKITRNVLDKFHINIHIERLIYYLVGLFMFIHLSSCLFFFITKLEEFSPDCWVNRLGLTDSSPFELYITSFYWSLTTVTTVGYGDVVSYTKYEKIYNLFIMSFGVVMYSFLIGMLSNIVEIIDQKNSEMNMKLNDLQEIKYIYDIDDEIYEKTRKIIKYDLTKSQEQKRNFLLELPNKLRLELSRIINDNVIKKIIFFQDKPELINFILPLLKQMRYGKNENIYKIGEIPDEMYFIIKGTVIFYLGEEYNYQQIYEVKKNRNFGEIEMCLNEKLSHNIKVKTRQCELFLLKKNDFLKTSVNFPEQIQNFLSISLMKYLRFNDEKKRIMIENQKEIEFNESTLKSNDDLNDLSHISEESNTVTNKATSSISKFESSLSSSSKSSDSKSSKSQSDKSKLTKSKISYRSNTEQSQNSQKIKELSFYKLKKPSHSITSKSAFFFCNRNDKDKTVKRKSYILNEKKNLLNQIEIPKKKTFSTIQNSNLNAIDINKLSKKQLNTTFNLKHVKTKEKNSNLNKMKTCNPTLKKERRSSLNLINVKRFSVLSPKNTHNYLRDTFLQKNTLHDNYLNNVEIFKDVRDTASYVEKNLNENFYNNIDKMVNVLEKNKTKLGKNLNNSKINPISILNKLKSSLDFSERNELINQLGNIINDVNDN